ncbi:MAG: hypothetical protein FWD97_01760 [Defluviitaleaceae bacterium]|nr:hypothetical protein [Defluviitaleaceae bacterium]
MSNKVNKDMGFSAFNNQVNIELFNDVVEFIAATASADNSMTILRHLKATNLWYTQTHDENIRHKYGFRYFGELLERYEERFGSDIADIRAIALAMAYSKDMLSDDMFVGRQKDDFIRRFTRLSEANQSTGKGFAVSLETEVETEAKLGGAAKFEAKYLSEVQSVPRIASPEIGSITATSSQMNLGMCLDIHIDTQSNGCSGVGTLVSTSTVVGSAQATPEEDVADEKGLRMSATSANTSAEYSEPTLTASGRDLYLTGALYLLGKGEKDIQGLLNHLTKVTYSKTEELIFAVSLFDNFEEAFTVFKSQLLKLFGKDNSIKIVGDLCSGVSVNINDQLNSIMGSHLIGVTDNAINEDAAIKPSNNIGIYCWLIKNLRRDSGSWMKSMRTKDMVLFRALAELPVSFVKEGSRHHTTLLNNGYTTYDILFLNSILIRYKITNDTLHPDSIVAHKIAVHTCETFINSENAHTRDVYEHLEWLLNKYHNFTIKIGGDEGIYKAIQNTIKLSNPLTFLWLYRIVRPRDVRNYHWINRLPEAVFDFDIIDKRWDVLSAVATDNSDDESVTSFSADCYRHLFTNHLLRRGRKFSKDQLEEYIQKYNDLTGSPYLSIFENEHLHVGELVFPLMVEKDIFNLVDAFEASRDKYILSRNAVSEATSKGTQNKDGPPVLCYILDYVKSIPSRQAFEFLQHLRSKYSFEVIRELVAARGYKSEDDFFMDPFYVLIRRNYGNNDTYHIKIKKDFLTDEEHRQLFEWLDEYIFTYKSNKYTDFTVIMLLDDFINDIYPKEELLPIYHSIKNLDTVLMKQHGNANRLKNKFLTEVELQTERDADEAREAERRRLAKEAEIKGFRDDIQTIYNGTFKSIHDFLEKYRYRNQREVDIVAMEYLILTLTEADYSVCSEDISYFLISGAKLQEKGAISFNDFKSYISKIKEVVVSEDISCSDSIDDVV